MKALVVYDSVFGNTEKVAQAIGAALGPEGDVTVLKAGDAQPAQLQGIELLVVGSPTRAFSATPAIRAFLRRIPAKGLQGVKVAAFDTRMVVAEANSAILSFMVKLFGYAAEPMGAKLERKGGERAAAPEGFFVGGTEGPMKDGELERARVWAKEMLI